MALEGLGSSLRFVRTMLHHSSRHAPRSELSFVTEPDASGFTHPRRSLWSLAADGNGPYVFRGRRLLWLRTHLVDFREWAVPFSRGIAPLRNRTALMATAAAQATSTIEAVSATRIQQFVRNQVRRVKLQRLLASRVKLRTMGDAMVVARPSATANVAEVALKALKELPRRHQGSQGPDADGLHGADRFALKLGPGLSALVIAQRRARCRRHLKAWWVLSVAERRDRAAAVLQRFSVVVRNRVARRLMKIVFLAWARWLRWALVSPAAARCVRHSQIYC